MLLLPVGRGGRQCQTRYCGRLSGNPSKHIIDDSFHPRGVHLLLLMVRPSRRPSTSA